MEKSKVYFTRKITPESVVKMYETLGVTLPGKVAVKLHSGEQGNQNYIRPEFVKAIVEKVSGTVVECNTAYGGALKQLSIGCGSSEGKAWIHSAGVTKDQNKLKTLA